MEKKPLSEARLRANRANALKSTGPRTIEGKQRSSRNALKHALTARDLTALGESYDTLPATIRHFAESWAPRNAYEKSLVIHLATLYLRLNRCARMETGLLDAGMPLVNAEDSAEVVNAAIAASFTYHERNFTNLSRYEANLSRAYDRTIKQLMAVRKLDPVEEESVDETNPTSVENTSPAPESEAGNNRRLELESGPPSPEVGERRLGLQPPIRKQSRRTVELVWDCEPVKPDTPKSA